jgi:WD40 repeat protein
MHFQAKRVIVSHTAAVYSLANGSHADSIYSASGDRFMAEWNLLTGEQEPMAIRLEQPVFSMCSINQDNLLIAGCANGAIHVIDLLNKKEVHHLALHTKGIYDFYYQPLSKQLIALGGDGLLSVWSVPDFKLLYKIKLSEAKLRQLAYSERYGLYAIACGDGCVYLLAEASFTTQRVLKAHAQGATSVAWHPSKPILLSGGRDALLKVWNTATEYEMLMEIPAHNYAIYSIVFDVSNTYIATGSRDKTIKIWDSNTLDVLQRIDVKSGGHTHSVNKLLWSGSHLISAGDDRKIIVWENA